MRQGRQMPLMDKKSIYVIILNYNNAPDTIECVKSLERERELYVHTVIVDNGSEGECITEIERQIVSLENVVLLKTGANLGYAGGNNIGILYAIENNADYIAILNNDTIINETTFDPCVRLLEEDPEIGLIGPCILLYGTNTIQYAGGTFNCWTMKVNRLRENTTYIRSEELIPCDYVGGACIVFKPDVIQKIGYLPECYFLFWEESEWCVKAKRAGLKCVCTMEGSIHHKGSATVNKTEGLMAHYLERNTIVFSRRYDRNPIRRIFAYLYVNAKAIAKGFLRNKSFFKNVKYYFEGIWYKYEKE